MVWPEAVVYTYTVGAVAAAVRLLTPLDGMHTFSTLTNVAYLAVGENRHSPVSPPKPSSSLTHPRTWHSAASNN